MEGDYYDTDFSSHSLTSPGEIAGVKAECTVLGVATSNAYKMDSFVADTSVCWLTTFLEGSVNTLLDLCLIDVNEYKHLFFR